MFEYAELKLAFDYLLDDLSMGFDPYSDERNPSLYWIEVFSRLIAISDGHNLDEVPNEARHIAGQYLISELVKNEQLIKEAENASELFKLKQIDNYDLENKEWWKTLKSRAPISCEKVERILSKYLEKTVKLNE